MTQAIESRLSRPAGDAAALLRVFEAARRFLAHRARAAALAERGTGDDPRPSLAEAIERDFLAFDISRAEHELREAVLAIDSMPFPIPINEGRQDGDDAGAVGG